MQKRTLAFCTATIIGLAGIAGIAGIAGCGGKDNKSSDLGDMSMANPSVSTSTSAAPAAQHNDQDVMFAQAMSAHHQQAVEMARLAVTKAKNPAVKTLAGQIEQAQGPEIKTMTGWLNSWGVTPSPSGGGMPGMPGMDKGPGQGMMSAAEMKKLDKASGAAFDKMFLTMMIKHHEGAITMAKVEQANGSYDPAKTLAANIVSGQSAQIATMRSLLK
ncbi:MAG: copper resistance protein [Actinomycetia bacterium]|nr:copper resistance protein [Actinomycetes bacterium]